MRKNLDVKASEFISDVTGQDGVNHERFDCFGEIQI